MAILNPVILPAKALKGGRHKVRISVAHNGDVRYINTDIILDDISEFKKGNVRKRPDAQYLNTKIRKILNKYSEALDEIEYSCLSCSELVSLLKSSRTTHHMTFRDALNEYLEVKQSSYSTNRLYNLSVQSLEESIGVIHIAGLNRKHIMKYVKDLKTKRRLSDPTIYTYICKLKALMNYVLKCGYIKADTRIFDDLELNHAKPRECWLTEDDVRTIRDFKSDNSRLVFYRDVFMLSYYLGGINAVDLFNADLSGDNIQYIRRKTIRTLGTTIKFGIPEEARQIVSRLANKDGAIYCLSRKNISVRVGNWMKILGKEVGIPNLVYYSARKSFAQHALSLGISECVIDYILGHSLRGSGNRSSCLYHYIYVTPEMATDAIRKVLDNLAEK